jgi:3-methyladenine DNA glycosylase Tag
MGKDSFILSRDVVTALRREGIFTGSPTSKSSLVAIQAAFNEWVADGGRSLTRVSRVLAFTVG